MKRQSNRTNSAVSRGGLVIVLIHVVAFALLGAFMGYWFNRPMVENAVVAMSAGFVVGIVAAMHVVENNYLRTVVALVHVLAAASIGGVLGLWLSYPVATAAIVGAIFGLIPAAIVMAGRWRRKDARPLKR